MSTGRHALVLLAGGMRGAGLFAGLFGRAFFAEVSAHWDVLCLTCVEASTGILSAALHVAPVCGSVLQVRGRRR